MILPTNKLQPDVAANDSVRYCKTAVLNFHHNLTSIFLQTDPATESTTLESVSFVALSDDAAVEEI